MVFPSEATGDSPSQERQMLQPGIKEPRMEALQQIPDSDFNQALFSNPAWIVFRND